jgi:hypothetical protein
LRRQTRADIFWLFVTFVAFQAGLAVAIVFWFPELRDPGYGNKSAYLRRVLREETKPVKTLVALGSSRTMNGFRAAHFAERVRDYTGQPVLAFNFGMAGSGPVRQLVSLRRLRAEGVRPDVLLLELVPFMLAGQEWSTQELKRMSPTLFWPEELPLLDRYGCPSKDFHRDCWLSWCAPWYYQRFSLMNQVAPLWLPVHLRLGDPEGHDGLGWNRKFFFGATPEQRQESLRRTHEEFFFYFHGFRPTGPSARAMRDLLEFCRADGLTVAVILMPEGTAFRSWYPPYARDLITAYVDELSREFAVPVIDARDWIEEESFSDSHHMLAEGATVFTDRLSRHPVVIELLTTPHRRPVARQ